VQFPIIIGLHRSRFLDSLLCLTSLLAAAAILGYQGSPAVKVGLLGLLFVLALLAWRGLAPTIESIRLERSGAIFIARVGVGEFVQAIPQTGATIHPWLVVIRFSTIDDGLPATLIATVNRKNRPNLKRLRMFMRWQASFSDLNDDA
jgi:toxin CptA